MPISPEQIASLRSSAGLSPTPPQVGGNDLLAQRRQALGLDKEQPTTGGEQTVGGEQAQNGPVTYQPGSYQKGVSEAAQGGWNQMKQAILESQAGKNPLETGIKFGEGAIGAVTSPIAPLLKPLSDSIQFAGDQLSNLYGEKGQKYLFEHPELSDKIQRITEDIRGLSTIAGIGAGAVGTPEVIQASKEVLPTIKAAGQEAKTGIQAGLKKADTVFTKATEPSPSQLSIQENMAYNKRLTDAYESVFTRLSPTEKASIQLKDIGGGFTKKSVPDFVSDPKTKPIVESVANLPEDIQLKPSDTLAERTSKLDQGISRLHQETEGSLAEPTIKAQTSFNDSRFNKYMNDNVLRPIENEFGVDSAEYTAAQKAVKTAKQSIESNDAHGVHVGRQQFTSMWEKENPTMFKRSKASFGSQLDPKTTATVEAGRTVYNALNDFNEELLPANHPLRARMREESNLIRAKQEMRARSTGEVGQTNIARTLNRHPVLKKAVKTAADVAKVGTGLELAGVK